MHAADLLQTFDDSSSQTTYAYDDNGNLTAINAAVVTTYTYTYNQRNMLTAAWQGAGQQAGYLYDGSGNRVQQIDYTGSQPITTTYSNDNLGLSQVLVANDGTTTTHNLFGLDLISQQTNGQTNHRFLLADGLGSARTEMVGSAVETMTTYEPFGNLLAQTGASGTTYGFTGEQHDAATGLLYLRARYYNPTTHAFMGRDAHPGQPRLPSTWATSSPSSAHRSA